MALSNEIFFKLLDNAKEQECTLDNFSIKLKSDCYIIECYKWYGEDLGSEFTIECCGYEVFGKWENETLTDFQYILLQSTFHKMRDEWLENYEDEQRAELDLQNEEPNGGIDNFHFYNNIY